MPQYLNAHGDKNPAKSVYPGQNALAIGGKIIPDGPTALQTEQLEAVTTGYVSIPVCLAPSAAGSGGFTGKQVTWQCTYGVEPSAVTWTLEGSINDIDDEYQPVDTSNVTGIFTQTVATNFRFFRVRATSVTGACTAAVKITGA